MVVIGFVFGESSLKITGSANVKDLSLFVKECVDSRFGWKIMMTHSGVKCRVSNTLKLNLVFLYEKD